MGITKNRGLLAVLAAGLILVGCASKEPEEVTSEPEATEVVNTDRGSMETSAPEPVKPSINNRGQIVLPLDSFGNGTETLDGVFYFDFDQAIVKRSGHAELDKHAKALMSDRTLRVRLEGHADERGTREYNLALGERRANAVRAYLTAQGASRSQIEVISYGEEKPAVLGGGESSWAQNRRVEIKYRN